MELFSALTLLFVVNLGQVQSLPYTTKWPSSDSALDFPKRQELLKTLKPYINDWKIPGSLYDVGGEHHFQERRAYDDNNNNNEATFNRFRLKHHATGPQKLNSMASMQSKKGRSYAQMDSTLKVILITSVIIGATGVLVIIVILLHCQAKDAKRLGCTEVNEGTPLLRGSSRACYAAGSNDIKMFNSI